METSLYVTRYETKIFYYIWHLAVKTCMTDHFFYHPLVNLHYYRFGSGKKAMLCFHGYGMHGKQFRVLTEKLGDEYTFYGFDLFFHKETKLNDNSVEHLKKGISKAEFCALINAFCTHESIDRFSIISYSLGTHYATVLAEQEASRIDKLIMMAPAFLRVFLPLRIASKNAVANYIFQKVFLSENIVKRMLKVCRKVGVFDDKGHQILLSEMGTLDLRFAFYANVTYLRHMEPNHTHLAKTLNEHQVDCYFIFGKRDPMFPSHLADRLIRSLTSVKKLVIDEDHDMVNANLPEQIYNLIHDDKS